MSRRKVHQSLIEAILEGESRVLEELLVGCSTHVLNKLSRVREESRVVYMPVLWFAVRKSDYTAARLLLSKGVQVDRKGYMKYKIGLLKFYTPLLFAVERGDVSMVELLIKHGADPFLKISGPKETEEEGGSFSYVSHMYPVELAIQLKNIQVLDSILKHSNPNRMYGEGEHTCNTCLCFALSTGLLKEDENFEVLKTILRHGGQVCGGEGGWGLYSVPGICKSLYNLMSLSFCIHASPMGWSMSGMDSAYAAFRLICETYYVHRHSMMYKAVKKFCGTITSVYGDENGKLNVSIDNKSIEHGFTWLMSYTTQPSRLQDICRVVIKDCCIPLTYDKVARLPIPKDLQNSLFPGYEFGMPSFT